MTARALGATALGALLVASHAAWFALGASAPPPAFEVTLTGEPTSARPSLRGDVPAALRARVRQRGDELPDDAAGLRRWRWRAEYRGGHVREVGASQLVGPFQDPTAPPCGGRITLGQALLDDGAAGPGTVAHLVRELLRRELAQQGGFPLGDFSAVRALELRWAERAAHPQDVDLVPAAARGYLRATAELEFQRVTVPVTLAVIPRVVEGELRVEVTARASLRFGSAVAQWLSDHLGGDRLATKLTRRQLAATLTSSLAPPPPLPLPGGGELTFRPCDAPSFVEASHATLPFSVELAPAPGAPQLLPPALGGPVPWRGLAPPPGAPPAPRPIALELSVDALNALLHGAWRAGLLDRQLAGSRLVERFHADPLVATYLSLRLTPPWLSMPPVLAVHRGGLRLAADSALTVEDGALHTLGRVWSAVQISTGAAGGPALRAELAELELACEARPRVLSPCYADLVAALRDRAADFSAPLTALLADLVHELFTQRTVGTPELPAELLVRSATPTLSVGEQPGAAALQLTFEVELREQPAASPISPAR